MGDPKYTLNREHDGFEEHERQKQQAYMKRIERGIERLIDAYGDGLLDQSEFEPRIKSMRERLAKMAAELQSRIDRQAMEMRLVIGHLQNFAEQVKTGLQHADWDTRRKIICGLVKRVEVDQEKVRVVYRVNPAPIEQNPGKTNAQDCLRRSDPK